MEWKDRDDERPEHDVCCLVKLKGCHQTEKAIYSKSNDTFLLDNPGSGYPLIPLDIDKFLIIPSY